MTGLVWPTGISTVFQMSLTVTFHSYNRKQMSADGGVQGEFDSVYHGEGDPDKIRKPPVLVTTRPHFVST